jgi:hypothetical protein
LIIPDIATSGIGVWLVIVLFAVCGWLFSGHNDLHCTSERMDVIRMVRGQMKNKRTFLKESVMKIRFALVRYSQYSPTCGLVFYVAGKKIKTLEGLESPEAQTILRELDRLGFDVVHDVGMPMMVEMALEKRNSWLGR